MKHVMCMAFISVSTILVSCGSPPADEPKAAMMLDSAASVPPKPRASEFADAKYSEIGKAGLDALSTGDVDQWMIHFADNAVTVWNNGDSLVGKPAITAYWKKRRGEVIDSMSFRNAIWLPLKINEPQSIEKPGIWLLGWYQVTTKYKNGNRMSQWIHADQHFDANNKIDRVVYYLDRAPINAALKK